MMEIGAHNQSRSIVPVRAMDDANLIRIGGEEGVDARCQFSHNGGLHVNSLSHHLRFEVHNLLLISSLHSHPLLPKLFLPVIERLGHREIQHHPNLLPETRCGVEKVLRRP